MNDAPPSRTFRLSTKLALLGLLNLGAFALIVALVNGAFTNVERLSAELAGAQMEKVLKNAKLTRRLTDVFTGMSLLGDTFLERQEVIREDGSRLLWEISQIRKDAEDEKLRDSLDTLARRLFLFLEQSSTINAILARQHVIERKAHEELTKLENTISRWMIDATLKGEDTSHMDQILALATGYRESLLVIENMHLKFHETELHSVQGDTRAETIAAIDDLLRRLQIIGASSKAVAAHGKRISYDMRHYRKTVSDLFAATDVLKTLFGDLELAKTDTLNLIGRMDRETEAQSQMTSERIVAIVEGSRAKVTLLAIAVASAIAIATILIIRRNINAPLDSIVRAITSVSQGNLEVRPSLNRSDEWGAIEAALDDMARQLMETYAALGESESRFRAIADNIQGVLWLSDPRTTKMLYASPAYERVWGRTREELYADPMSFAAPIHPDDLPMVDLALGQLPKTGRYDIEYRLVHDNGEILTIHDRAFPVYDDKGDIKLCAGVAEDITEWKRLQQEMGHAQKLQSVGRLAAGIAHDFNNLLQVIVGNLMLIQEETEKDWVYRGFLDSAVGAGRRGAELVSQIQTFSRKKALDPASFGAPALLKDMRAMLARTLGDAHKVEAVVDRAPPLATADTDSLRNALLNLGVNARDAMPNGGTVTLSAREAHLEEETVIGGQALAPGDYVVFSVADTGEGMSPEIAARAMEPFFTTKAVGHGTGLGLSMVHGFAAKSNGAAQIESVLGEGTTVSLFLPLNGGNA